MQITLAAVPYFWPREQLLAFYESIGSSPVGRIYLGETVCSKRKSLRVGEWLELARSLSALGKEVVLSTLTLLEAQSELSALRRLCHNGEFLVEANDMSAVALMREQGLPFVAGQSVNIYNRETLNFLHERGMQRWVMPVELSKAMLAEMLKDPPPMLETEVQVHGPLALAWSARCFTARHYQLPKDNCQFRCLDHAKGLPVYSQEAKEFLTLNGIQVQSAGIYDIIDEHGTMAALGVDALRIVPTGNNAVTVIENLRRRLDGEHIGEATGSELRHRGYWFGEAGMAG